MTSTLGELSRSDAERPRLYYVPPTGLTLAERATARSQERGLRETWALPGFEEDTPGRACLKAGIAYGFWGVGGAEAEALGELAAHLTDHAMQVLRSHRYIVTAVLVRDTATISVLALASRSTQPGNPGDHPGVRQHADSWGACRLAAGPCVYASVNLTG
ncbi:hypothetical protein ACWCQL_24295 [Streptomyces sp. NPDC002073]